VINGEIKRAKRLSLWLLVMNISQMKLKTKSSTEKVISTGDVGYLISGIKEAKEVKVEIL
jgi:GTP-binding protein LepA